MGDFEEEGTSEDRREVTRMECEGRGVMRGDEKGDERGEEGVR